MSNFDKTAETWARVVDLVYEILDEYDIKTWEDINYCALAFKWVELVQRYSGDEKAIKEELSRYLKGE